MFLARSVFAALYPIWLCLQQSMPNDESTDNLNFYLDYLVDFFLVSCSPFSPPPFHIRLHRVLVFQHIRRQLVSSFVPRNRCQQRRSTRGRNVCNFSSPGASCTLMPRALLRFNQCHNPLGPRRTVAHVPCTNFVSLPFSLPWVSFIRLNVKLSVTSYCFPANNILFPSSSTLIRCTHVNNYAHSDFGIFLGCRSLRYIVTF